LAVVSVAVDLVIIDDNGAIVQDDVIILFRLFVTNNDDKSVDLPRWNDNDGKLVVVVVVVVVVMKASVLCIVVSDDKSIIPTIISITVFFVFMRCSRRDTVNRGYRLVRLQQDRQRQEEFFLLS
jgi:hypothetical protein